MGPIKIIAFHQEGLIALMQGGHWGFTKYGPHPHRMAKYGRILIFSTVLASSKKIFANSIERKTPGILQSIVI